MNLSDYGLGWIKRFEGLRLSVYKDAAGLDTIGYGHLIRSGETFTTISESEAERILSQDVVNTEIFIDRLRENGILLTQNQFDALVSLVFNIGQKAFNKSTLYRIMREGSFSKVPPEFQRWSYAGGKKMKSLLRRRRAEECIFCGCSNETVEFAYTGIDKG